MPDDQPLTGLRLLVVDDEFFIALDITDILRAAGAEVIMATTVADALKHAQSDDLSAALLDVRLGRDLVEPVADLLAHREIPFIFYTGDTLTTTLHEKHAAAPLIQKPARQGSLVKALHDIVAAS